MRIVGTYMGGHDFNVAIVQDGRVVAAVEEERLSRHKHHGQQHGTTPSLGLSWLKQIGHMFEWLLVPLTAVVLSAVPALDAQTRLLLGRSLEFWVTEKRR